MLTFFADGAQWLQGHFQDPDGSRCLVAALSHLRRKHGITGAGTSHYLQDAMPRRRPLALFNDDCKNFGELRGVIGLARAVALLEWRKRRAHQREFLTRRTRLHSRKTLSGPAKTQVLPVVD